MNATELGKAEAMYSIAFMYLRGMGVAPSRERAIEFLSKAIEAKLDIAEKALLAIKTRTNDFNLF